MGKRGEIEKMVEELNQQLQDMNIINHQNDQNEEEDEI